MSFKDLFFFMPTYQRRIAKAGMSGFGKMVGWVLTLDDLFLRLYSLTFSKSISVSEILPTGWNRVSFHHTLSGETLQ
jgi:hypothetical protein